jgi:hypothetical protein
MASVRDANRPRATGSSTQLLFGQVRIAQAGGRLFAPLCRRLPRRLRGLLRFFLKPELAETLRILVNAGLFCLILEPGDFALGIALSFLVFLLTHRDRFSS